MSQSNRVQFLNTTPPGEHTKTGKPVLYWMQASVRTRFNHALEYAVHLANHRSTSLKVLFVLTPGYPGATQRHYRFLLQGVQAAVENLQNRGIPFFLAHGDPPEEVLRHAREASTIVTDRGYTRIQQQWRNAVAHRARCPVVQVESNVVVPVETASTREEYSAATFRPRINRHRDTFLVPLEPVAYTNADRKKPSTSLRVPSLDTLAEADRPDTTSEHAPITGGEDAAQRMLQRFLTDRLEEYATLRNVPDRDWTSRLSPYLHFGHISPVEIALSALEYQERVDSSQIGESVDTLLEELIVRRELAINYVVFNSRYDTYDALPQWARTTLREHSTDDRPRIYSLRQLENAETHDPYWNACQQQMLKSGVMHGYMRMYWGKKILEWMQDPEDAFYAALELNDRWELDGRDPNGYAGVAWCFGKHDRPWVERPVFGKVRYMNDRGLKRKFKQIDQYVTRWTG